MANVTISIDDKLLKEGRKYARMHGTSLNSLLRQLLSKTVAPTSNDWLEECFRLMDRAKGDSKGEKWNREDLYDV
ncbi:MAG: hypothetical protein KAT34_04435 [Candidatus Aminicenantes bacterium]|nr:hypothetical protein [Candidatus Aminicenantes bacterium]